MVDLFVGLHEKSDPQKKRLGQDSDPTLFAKRRAFAATWWSWAPLWVAGHGVSLGNLASLPWQTALLQAYRPGDCCFFLFGRSLKKGDRLKMNNDLFFAHNFRGVFFHSWGGNQEVVGVGGREGMFWDENCRVWKLRFLRHSFFLMC